MTRLMDAELLRSWFMSYPHSFEVFTTTKLEFLEVMCQDSPVDVALVDVRFPGRAAVDLGHKLLSNGWVSRVLFLDREHCTIREGICMEMGATYCSRNVSLNDLLRVTLKLAKRETLPRSDHAALRVNESLQRIDPSHFLRATPRELDIWKLIAEGYSASESAEILGIAESTVDNHRSRLMKKLDVHSSVKLARMAIRLGIVDA